MALPRDGPRPISAENPPPDGPLADFAAETAEDPAPATHAPFSAPSYAHAAAPHDGFAAPAESLPQTPSEQPHARGGQDDGGVDDGDLSSWSDVDEDLVDVARAVFAGMVAGEAPSTSDDGHQEVHR